MIIDGEKYACDACVRGHRVSNCQHSDRPLQHINKKGRPVSQCQHCRAMRKSRAAHVKCDCGEKTSKCQHLQPTLDGHKDTCCCNHGGRCSCSAKKEPLLDTVPESDSEGESHLSATSTRPKLVARRRRANTVHESGLSFDQNGHHKPTSKINRASQKAGPYQLNRVNSANSATSLGASSEDLCKTNTGGRARATSTREQRKVRSEAASPLMSSSSFPQVNGSLPPLDLSSIEYPSYLYNNTMDLFGTGFASENDAPIYSAGLSAASVDWSHYDLGDVKGDNFAPSSYSQAGAQSFNGLMDFGSGSEQLPALANTTSTSGDVSEVEDFMNGADGDYDGFGANSFFRQNSMFNSADLSSIDYDSFANDAFPKAPETGPMAGAGISMVEDDPVFWVSDYANDNGMAAVDESPDPLVSANVNTFWEG